MTFQTLPFGVCCFRISNKFRNPINHTRKMADFLSKVSKCCGPRFQETSENLQVFSSFVITTMLPINALSWIRVNEEGEYTFCQNAPNRWVRIAKVGCQHLSDTIDTVVALEKWQFYSLAVRPHLEKISKVSRLINYIFESVDQSFVILEVMDKNPRYRHIYAFISTQKTHEYTQARQHLADPEKLRQYDSELFYSVAKLIKSVMKVCLTIFSLTFSSSYYSYKVASCLPAFLDVFLIGCKGVDGEEKMRQKHERIWAQYTVVQ